jgi:hypothetical protein
VAAGCPREGLVKKIVIVAAGALLAAALFLVLRPEDDEEITPTQPAVTTAATETAPAPPEPRPEVRTLRVQVRDGEVVGGFRRLTVEKGSRVRIVVRADVRDHVHLHGYDVMRDVGPGAPAQIALRATVPGRFEIELEERKLLVAELEVRP